MELKELIQKQSIGNWQPNYMLSNLAIINYESAAFKSRRVFPTIPVQLPSGFYYTFSTADLARDNVHRKPDFGHVQPAVFSLSEDKYICKLDQILVGIDRLMAQPYRTAADMGLGIEVYRQRVPMVVEQMNIHMERIFAENFFKSGVWANEWQGAASENVAQKKFQKFSNANSDPAKFIDERATDIKLRGRRKPNKLVLGVETYLALKNNPAIKERVKYTGSTANPAVVNENALAQIFGVEQVITLDTTYNAGGVGKSDMQFICDSKGALLLFAPDNPSIDTPAAGYIFAYQINGNDYIALDVFDADRASHTEFVEGLIAVDMKKTSDTLACYLSECV